MTALPRTMKAGQWDPKQKKVVINTIPIPEPGPNEILVKITSASLCHTDIISIERPDVDEPFTLGHEGVGIIDRIHSSIHGQGWNTGDAIGFLYILGCCFECEGCRVHNLLCLNGNPELSGFTKPGFFAEYAIVDHRNCIHLPPNFSLQTSSVFFCAGMTGKSCTAPILYRFLYTHMLIHHCQHLTQSTHVNYSRASGWVLLVRVAWVRSARNMLKPWT